MDLRPLFPVYTQVRGSMAYGTGVLKKQSSCRMQFLVVLNRYVTKVTMAMGNVFAWQRGRRPPDKEGFLFIPVFFRSHQQANCILKCSISSAVESCGCYPWYLRDNIELRSESPLQLCEAFGNECFRLAVADRYRRLKNEVSTNLSTYVWCRDQKRFSKAKQKNSRETFLVLAKKDPMQAGLDILLIT